MRTQGADGRGLRTEGSAPASPGSRRIPGLAGSGPRGGERLRPSCGLWHLDLAAPANSSLAEHTWSRPQQQKAAQGTLSLRV